MDQNTVLFTLTYGTVSSWVVSLLKMKGLSDKWQVPANILVSGVSNFVYSVSQGMDPKTAAVNAVLSYFSSHLYYESVGQHAYTAMKGTK